jgi:hypothetical protein
MKLCRCHAVSGNLFWEIQIVVDHQKELRWHGMQTARRNVQTTIQQLKWNMLEGYASFKEFLRTQGWVGRGPG